MKLNLNLLAGLLAALPLCASAQVSGDYRSVTSGNYSDATFAPWEKYNGTAWATPTAVPGSANNVTVKSGHNIYLTASTTSALSLTIESGGTLRSDGAAQRTMRIYGATLLNNGTLGGAPADDSITLEMMAGTVATNTNKKVTISGTGTTTVNRLRIGNIAGGFTDTTVIDMNMTFNNAGVGLTAYYNSANNTAADNHTLTINAGKLVKLINGAALHATSNLSTNGAGTITYNVNGTLDMSGSTGTTNVVPNSITSTSVTTINVNGLMKLGTKFTTVNGAPSSTMGSLALNIGSTGTVEAISLLDANAKFDSTLWVVSAGGMMKRVVAASDTVFPVTTAATSNNSVYLKNTGTADTFGVALQNTFSNTWPATALNKLVNRQWKITEATAGGSNLTVKLMWVTADQASGFNAASPISVYVFTGQRWKEVTGTISGAGTLLVPYVATVTGIDSFQTLVIGNQGLATPGVVAAATITTTGTLSAFSQIVGVPSATQSFTVSGSTLTADITVTAPTGFQISLDNGTTWVTSGTIAQTGGSVTNATVKVRLNAATQGSYSGNITLTSTGAPTVNVPVTGTSVPNGIQNVASVQDGDVVIAPNPVVNRQVQVQLSNLLAGTYQATIFNFMGQKVSTASIRYNGQAASFTITLPETAPAGLYELQLTNGQVKADRKIVVQ